MSSLLSSHKKLMERGNQNWSRFLEKRSKRLIQMNRPGGGAEKITEQILEDLLSIVLDWDLSAIPAGA